VFRKTIFWIHLICGVTAGVVILIMSVTGVLLTYERQMLAAAERAQYAPPPPDAQRLSVAGLLSAGKLAAPDFEPSAVSYRAEPGAPVTLTAGRRGSVKLDAYTGELRPEAAPRMAAFFDAMTGWHRWFNAGGESRQAARAVTGASNLIFLFLILSGLYLWLPRMYRWAAFKARLKFSAVYPNGKARDFNWHHVIGFWTALPLTVVVATATVFSYGWANNLVYLAAGEAPPVRGGPGPGGPAGARAAAGEQPSTQQASAEYGDAARQTRMSLDSLLVHVMQSSGEWQQITLNLPAAQAQTVSFRVDRGNGAQPQLRHDLALNAYTGEIAQLRSFDAQSTGQQARSIIRFLHTGEVLGWPGQTIAGLVSLTSALMVWTGLALAYRRLIVPMLKPRRSS
jgi:uncharacterized iron-regulated membrane protein